MRFLLRTAFATFVLAFYFIFAPFGYLAFYLWSLLPTRDPARRARILLGIQRRAFRMMHRVGRRIRAIDFDPDALADAQPNQPSILIANHPTLTDTTASLASFPNTVTVVKPTLFHRWWAKPLFVSAGFLESPGADYTRLPAVIDEAAVRLAQGFNVLFFPEGTRSPEGELLPFGRSGFEIACRTGAPVIPIVITCTPLWLSKEYPIYRLRPEVAKLRLNVLPAVHPSEHDFNSRALRTAVRDQIAAHLQLSTSSLPLGPSHVRISEHPIEAAHHRHPSVG